MPEKPPLEVAFHKVRFLIRSQCRRFHNRYGGDLEELVAESNARFTILYTTLFDPEKGDLRSFTSSRIMMGLLSAERKEAARKAITDVQSRPDMDTIPHQESRTFDLKEFLSGCASRIRLDCEKAIRTLFTDKFLKMENALLVRGELRKHLQSAGWSRRHTKEVFDEIRRALA